MLVVLRVCNVRSAETNLPKHDDAAERHIRQNPASPPIGIIYRKIRLATADALRAKRWEVKVMVQEVIVMVQGIIVMVQGVIVMVQGVIVSGVDW